MQSADLFDTAAPVNDNRIQRITRTLGYVSDSRIELTVKDPSGHPVTLAKSAIDWAFAKGDQVEVTLPQRLAREKGLA